MVIKLFGSPVSACTACELVCMEEIGLEYELVPIDLNTCKNMRNAFGQFPFQDGDLTLYESRVITRYLVRKYGKGTDLLKENSFVDSVAVDQWMEVETQHFHGPISNIVFYYLLLPLIFEKSTNDMEVAEDVEKLGKVLDIYEARLSKTKFLAGDFYSLADLHHLPYGHYLITRTPHGSLINSRPHVKAWWDEINSRPASKKVLAAMSSTT